ncbi:MAG: ABC transporter permease subunit [Planctomycetes bacterium]|nr:ABC transporter permease subunit [Planctomycetota bacterium]
MIRSALKLLPRGLFGPVFDRELRATSRHTASFWVRSLYTLALAALASLVYFAITVDVRFANAGNASALQQVQMFAPTLGAFFVWFQFVIMCFVASTLTAGAVCDERRKGSLASLLATPLTPGQIVLGKLSGRLAQLVVLIATGVPLLLAARLFGGISSGFVLSAMALTVSTAILHASISLAASTRSRSSTTAASSGFITGVVWCFAPIFLTLLLSIGHNGPRSFVLLKLSPYVCLGMETASSLGAGNAPFYRPGQWLLAAAYNGVGTGLFLLLAVARLRAVASKGETELPRANTRKQRGISKAGTPASPLRMNAARPTSDPLGVWDNPLNWRELRQRVFVRRWHAWAVGGSVVLLLAIIYSEAGINQGDVLIPTSAILIALFYFQCALIAANSIAGERESRSLEVLLTTPLAARAIVRAKWLGALRRASPIAILYFGIVIGFGVVPGTFHWMLVPLLALIVLPPMMFLIATGVWFSVLARRSTVAATLNLGLGLAIWAVLPLVLLVFGAILSAMAPDLISEEMIVCLAIWNPAPMTVTAIEGTQFGPWNQLRPNSFHTFAKFTTETFAATSLAFAGGYILLTWLALRRAGSSLAARTNRSV